GIDDTVVAPYTPLLVGSQTISCLGRELTFDDFGLPKQILVADHPLLFDPVSFNVVAESGQTMSLRSAKARITHMSPAAVSWESIASVEQATVTCRATMEFDGHVDYHLTLHSDQGLAVRDVRLDLPIYEDAATYLMGIGR